jgi:hypothetical protein
VSCPLSFYQHWSYGILHGFSFGRRFLQGTLVVTLDFVHGDYALRSIDDRKNVSVARIFIEREDR